MPLAPGSPSTRPASSAGPWSSADRSSADIAIIAGSTSWRTKPKPNSRSSCAPRPRITRSPRAVADSRTAASTAVLPMPARPSITSRLPWPDCARSSVASARDMTSSRSSRPVIMRTPLSHAARRSARPGIMWNVAVRTVDEHALGLSWVAEDYLSRAAHALLTDGKVWFVDPFDEDDAIERGAALGEPAGVLQLYFDHDRASADVAERLGVPHHKLVDIVPDAPFSVIPVS